MVGNISNYTRIDILRAFLLLEKNISREKLVKELDIGEGTVRTILDILKKKVLTKSTKKGHFLSKKGNYLLKKLKYNIRDIKKIESNKIYPKYKKIAILLKKIKKINIDYKFRDIAVKNGAEGALIFQYKNNKLTLPFFNKKDTFSLEKMFDFENGDILILSFANSYRWAEIGALAVAMELGKLKIF